ncbi:RNA-binding cell elongation regulator Jag/EloR [Anaerolineales bacterium HSG6]|nr:RNA-binding cell elongation regulator Jag/EloR [Anaerolineales bacterium HSG6]MDM8533049.1 RNA-binding cell elongation regulator Jag/EloR [Anaerolineales bacterium HSG25]
MQRKSLNVSAKTVDDAIAKGLAQIGLSRDQVDIQIVKEGRRGVFGIGAEDAQIIITERDVEPVAPPPPPPETTMPETAEVADEPPIEVTDESVEPVAEVVSAETESESPEVVETTADEETVDDSPTPTDVETCGITYLTDLLDNMGIQAEVTSRLGTDLVDEGESPPLVFDITGKDLGILIGRRNATLRSLQYIMRLSVNKATGNRKPVLVDVESYRVRRRQSLQQLAIQMADQAIKKRRRVVLESMSAYERRIIHVTLRDHKSVRTKSIGGNDNRKVTIIPK